MQIRLVASVVCLTLFGCRQERKPPPPKPKATWSWNHNQLVVSGTSACASFPCKVRVNVAQDLSGTRALSFAVEEGTGRFHLTLGGARKELLSRTTFPLKLEQLGALELATGKVQLASPVHVELEEHEAFDLALPPLPFAASALFSEPGKIVFEGDRDDPARTIYVVGGARLSLKARVIGPGTLARDVDWVVKETRVESGQRVCTGYRDTRTGEKATVVAFAYDSRMTVTDRRTGEVVKEEVLRGGAPSCPSLSIGFAGGVTEVPDARIVAWVDQLK